MKRWFALSVASSLALFTLVGCGSKAADNDVVGPDGLQTDGTYAAPEGCRQTMANHVCADAPAASAPSSGASSTDDDAAVMCAPTVVGSFVTPPHAQRQPGLCSPAELDALAIACADPSSSDCISALKDEGPITEDCSVCAMTNEDTGAQLSGLPAGALLANGAHLYINQGGCVGLQDPSCEDQATKLTECIDHACTACDDATCPTKAASSVCSSYALDAKCTQSIAAEKFPACFPGASTDPVTFVRGIFALFCG